MRKFRRLLMIGVTCALIMVAAVPALAARGTIRTTDGSGHVEYSVTVHKDPDSGGRTVRKTISIKACDDRKDGAGIVASVVTRGQAEARRGAGTCSKVRTFAASQLLRLVVIVCRHDASKNGPLVKCRQRTVSD
jgi:hypothetical protein